MSNCEHNRLDVCECDYCGQLIVVCADCGTVISDCLCLTCDQCGDLVTKGNSTLFQRKTINHCFRLCNSCSRELEPILTDVEIVV